jgi:hypothetical protein
MPPVFRAFTSNVVIKRIREKEAIKIDTPSQALRTRFSRRLHPGDRSIIAYYSRHRVSAVVESTSGVIVISLRN